MDLCSEARKPVVSPTADQIETELHKLDGDGNSFAILGLDGLTYLQTAGGPSTGFVLEYQEGDTTQHFQSMREDYPITFVVKMFQAYAQSDESWRTMVEWKPMVVESKTTNRALIALAIAIAIGFIVYSVARGR